MTENKIIELFSINPASSVPLKTQLEQKLEHFINNSPTGTIIPSERLLAKCLGISRVTVRNSITPFLESGLVVRHNRNGTSVAPRNTKHNISVNELAIGLPWHMQPVTTLKFLCYETLPAQKIFWQKTVDAFNDTHDGCKINIVWMEKTLKSHALLDFIAKNEIDIMLHSCMFELSSEESAAELPLDLQKIHKHDEFILKDIKISDVEQFKYMLPFQIVFSKIFYNNDLVKKCRLKDVNKKLFENKKINLMQEALPQLKASQQASSHIWCHLAYQGIKPDKKNLPKLINVLEEMCSTKNFDNAFMLEQSYSLDDAEKFLNGEMLFFDGIISQLHTIGTPSFDMQQQISSQIEDTMKFATSINIEICKQCRNYDFAADFLRFLTTDEVQKNISCIKKEFPIKSFLLKEAAQKQCALSEAQIQLILSKTFLFQSSDSSQENAVYFYIFECRDLLKKMMKGQISATECAEEILVYWNDFCRKRESI